MRKLRLYVQRLIKTSLKPDEVKIEPVVQFLSTKELLEIKSTLDTPIKRYSKSDLAFMYKRNIQTFMKWIRNNKALFCELKKKGYQSSQKDFSKEQVLLIFAYLGEP